MDSRRFASLQTPHRLTELQYKVIAVLAIAILGIAASGLVVYDGVPRIIHVGALALVGLTNLVWVIGSVLPEERGGHAARAAVVPLALLMIVALFASVSLLWRQLSLDAVIVVLFGAAAGLVAARWIQQQ